MTLKECLAECPRATGRIGRPGPAAGRDGQQHRRRVDGFRLEAREIRRRQALGQFSQALEPVLVIGTDPALEKQADVAAEQVPAELGRVTPFDACSAISRGQFEGRHRLALPPRTGQQPRRSRTRRSGRSRARQCRDRADSTPSAMIAPGPLAAPSKLYSVWPFPRSAHGDQRLKFSKSFTSANTVACGASIVIARITTARSGRSRYAYAAAATISAASTTTMRRSAIMTMRFHGLDGAQSIAQAHDAPLSRRCSIQ